MAQLDVTIASPASSPASVTAGVEATFQARATWDGQPLDGLSVTYEWDFDDETDPDADNPTTHTFLSAGTYSVSVTATYSGQEDTASMLCQAPAVDQVLSLVPDSGTVSDPWGVEVRGPASMWPTTWSLLHYETRPPGGAWTETTRIVNNVGSPRWDQESNETVYSATWATAWEKNGSVEVRAWITRTTYFPYATRQYYTDPVSTNVLNMVATPDPEDADKLVFWYDPDPNSGADAPVLKWDATHQQFGVHAGWQNEHIHADVTIRGLAGGSYEVTVYQDAPGPGELTWDGSGAMAPAPRGLYTYEVELSHKTRADQFGPDDHDEYCLTAPNCYDVDKKPAVASVTDFDPELDDVNDTISGTVSYQLTSAVGECHVFIYGPRAQKLWEWTGDAPDCAAGTHETDEYEIETVVLGDILPGADQYYAVVVTKQTGADGLGNRDQLPKWHVPVGARLPASGVALLEVQFLDKTQMHWPVLPGDGDDEGVGVEGPGDKTPEWTVYPVFQEHLTKRPYEDATYATPQPKREPASDVRNGPLHVEVTIAASAAHWVKVTGSLIPEDTPVISQTAVGADGLLRFDFTTPQSLPNYIDTATETWTWWVIPGAGNPTQPAADDPNWQSLGATEHKVYVTLAAPSGLSGRAYEQLFRLSCEWAEGRMDAQEAWDAPNEGNDVWAGISSLRIECEAGILTYYPMNIYDMHALGVGESATPTRELLTFGFGRCGNFGYFAFDLGRAHGIPILWAHFFAGVGPGAVDWRTFLVKDVDCQGHEHSAQPYFGDHLVCAYPDGQSLYDPSYGVLVESDQSVADALRSLEWEELSHFTTSPMPGSWLDPVDDPQAPYWNWQGNTESLLEIEL